MFGRIFGRGQDEPDQAVCAECGRTLLAGEWTQKVVNADGEELLICSLCGQNHAQSGAQPAPARATPANNGRVRESREDLPVPRVEARDQRTESDAFWKALKDKDAEIERLQAQLAGVEAEKQELAAQLARQRARAVGEPAVISAATPAAGPPQTAPLPAEPLIPSAAVAGAAQTSGSRPTGDSSEPGERTWGETPAEFAAELAALRDESATSESTAPAAELPPAEPAQATGIVFEDTQPIPTISDEPAAEAEAAHAVAVSAGPTGDPESTLTPEASAAESAAVATDAAVSSIAAETAALEAATPQRPETGGSPEPESVAEPVPEPDAPVPTAADLEAEAASLTLLQRGVDLLNVSRVPHKIAETNEQLGLPSVHVGADGGTTAITFMWSMGWYRFHVDSESRDVRMVDRGYDELTDLRPNAGVRADGTVQLAPAQISRAAAAQRPQPEPQPAAEPKAAPAPSPPEPPSVAAQKPPEILSKSLLGQRSDDEAASWEKTQARDFDWDR